MAIKKSSIAEDLYDLLSQKGFEIKALNAEGNQDVDIKDADIFSFDYTHDGVNYGPVTVCLLEDLTLEVIVPDSLGKHLDDKQARDGWFDFLQELRHFSRSHGCSSFDLKNINQLPYRLKKNQNEQAKARMMESWERRGKQYSESKGPQATRLRIQHTRPLGETDARFRHVAKIFVETEEGERFAMPFKNIQGGRAMALHISEGGRPWDERGLHITEMVKEAAVLSNFCRGHYLDEISEDAHGITERAKNRLSNIRKLMKSVSTRNGYKKYFENFASQESMINEELVTEITSMFVRPRVDPRVEAAAPYLARMKEVADYEMRLDSLVEGTWALPNDRQDQDELVELFSKPIRLGGEAQDVESVLYNLIGDDQLYDQLHAAAETDPEADARPIILDWMRNQGQDFTEIQQLYAKLQKNVDITTDKNGVTAPKVEPKAGEPDPEEDPVARMRELSGIDQKNVPSNKAELK